MNLNPVAQTAKYAKYANKTDSAQEKAFSHWVNWAFCATHCAFAFTAWFGVPAALFCVLEIRLTAQTLVSGEVSGSWIAKNSPYVVIDNCTVPSGQRLTIEPGVTVIIGDNFTITVNGQLSAIGTPSKRITVKAPNDAVYWDKIQINFSPEPSHFRYCNFVNAMTALSIYIGPINETLRVLIENCSFRKCLKSGIYGEAVGGGGDVFQGGRFAVLLPEIRNCIFDTSNNGITFLIHGGCTPFSCGSGYTSPIISGNIFRDLTGAALELQIGSLAGGSKAGFVNNSIVMCAKGVVTSDPWDVEFKNNIVAQTKSAVQRTGSLSSQVGFNCFFQNPTNLVGYPPAIGSIVFENRNSTPADVAFNIFVDPRFVSTNDFHLSPGSPCVDAGAPGDAYKDVCLPAFGTELNDLGAYGGPSACGWLSNELPVIARIDSKEVNEETLLAFPVTVTDPDAPPQVLTFNLLNAPSGASIDRTLGFFTWIPSEEQGPGTYSITVEVRDNHKPTNGVSLETFTVKVNEINKPPAIDSIGQKVLKPGTELRVKVTVLDPDRPVLQSLTFSLDQGAPAGATIDPATGVFTWTPTAAQAASKQSISVRVTDNGSPPLSSAVTFLAVPDVCDLRLSAKRISGGMMRLTIDGCLVGTDYAIQAASELKSQPTTTSWTTLKVVRPGQFPFTFDDPEAATLPMRFYRLLKSQ